MNRKANIARMTLKEYSFFSAVSWNFCCGKNCCLAFSVSSKLQLTDCVEEEFRCFGVRNVDIDLVCSSNKAYLSLTLISSPSVEEGGRLFSFDSIRWVLLLVGKFVASSVKLCEDSQTRRLFSIGSNLFGNPEKLRCAVRKDLFRLLSIWIWRGLGLYEGLYDRWGLGIAGLLRILSSSSRLPPRRNEHRGSLTSMVEGIMDW